jgi:hypothetical protein
MAVSILRQTAVIVVLVLVIFGSFIPAGIFIRQNWDLESDLWKQNVRGGVMVALALPVWALTYTAAFIGLKWVFARKDTTTAILPHVVFWFCTLMDSVSACNSLGLFAGQPCF